MPLQLMHAGAVGYADGGVLLAGKSGSGKSTTALACLASDLLFASDDYVCVATTAQPWVHSLYSTAKLVPGNLSRFPELSGKLSNPDRLTTEKAMVNVHAHFPAKVLSGFPIRAILLPRAGAGADNRGSAGRPQPRDLRKDRVPFRQRTVVLARCWHRSHSDPCRHP